MRSVRRRPGVESVGLFPGLVVWDDRVSGSITIGRSRLPIWSIIASAIVSGWDEVEAGWEPTARYGFTEQHLVKFLHDLLQARGELARLLLILADVERLEQEREDAVFEEHAPGEGVVDITDGTVHGHPLPGRWWDDDELRGRVVEQLRRCIDVLEATP